MSKELDAIQDIAEANDIHGNYRGRGGRKRGTVPGCGQTSSKLKRIFQQARASVTRRAKPCTSIKD